ncbi:hypothetical protein FRC14_008204 [Serendipita sp. 396]|nr:hypothetical protein FRC14_008204 [Serendipita sp. 396]KAG8786325.1 hypothetical protein FRC15_011642 [Serendipita sp. 397]KAG8801619.1 hypothetical protein FRC16_011450 [Serendipita sp. 398]KAG8870341.1 hypothetical protein FRC20_011990 [Serendipita sp. 405]
MRSRQLEAIAPSRQTLDDNDVFLETYESQYGTMQFSTVILPGAATFTHRDSDSSLSPPPDSDSDSTSALPGPSSATDSRSGRLQKRQRPQPSPFQPQLPRPLTYPYRPSHSGHQRTITWSTSTYGAPGSSHGGDSSRPIHHRASSSAVISTAAAANARRREEGHSVKGRSMQVIQVEVDAIHAIRHFMRCNPDAVIPLSLIPSSFFEWEKEEVKGVEEGGEEQRSKGAGRELRAGWCLLGSCRQAREAVLRPQSLTTIAAPHSSNQPQLQLQQQQNVQPLPKNEKRLFRELYDHVRLDHFYSLPIKCENWWVFVLILGIY